MFESPPFWMWILGFLLVLGPLVTLHEFGHYLVGRLFGVKADAFSVGFGKEIAGFTDRRGTRWKLSALPLGGYVQFAGDMNPASQPSAEWLSLPEEERNRTFQSKPLWQRALIVAAGPLTNFLIAIAILGSFNLLYGKLVTPPVVEVVAEGSAAAEAGIEPGDRILSINGREMQSFEDLARWVSLYPGEPVTVRLERDGETRSLPAVLGTVHEQDRFGNEFKIGQLGIGSSQREVAAVGPVEALGLGVTQTGETVRAMVTGIWQIVTGRRSVEELGGPIKIAKFSGEQLSLGWRNFVGFAALISINLAFINLLPIPALDGGHLAFYAAEAVRRKPASARSQEWAFKTGIAFVLALMLFVTINDIVSLPIFGS
ncbi:peptidase [Altererythrobacter sp. B11]|uniref:RIP metalloprotease RseP n=1 Tax=Altererythrobacter sp. B11 TaxID=2060312 RepID=UPI000DC70569|nr:RIP metalloprotease RseP [Altererythrobacter sp. B11]BBC73632.1 peptidase [Altererythrobacter sp. B11]